MEVKAMSVFEVKSNLLHDFPKIMSTEIYKL